MTAGVTTSGATGAAISPSRQAGQMKESVLTAFRSSLMLLVHRGHETVMQSWVIVRPPPESGCSSAAPGPGPLARTVTVARPHMAKNPPLVRPQRSTIVLRRGFTEKVRTVHRFRMVKKHAGGKGGALWGT